MGHACFAQSSQEPMKIGSVTVQGSIRSRVEGWRWFEGQGNSDYAFSGTQLRLTFKQQSERFDWQLELEAPVLLGLPNDAVAPGAQGQLGLGGSYYVANHQNRNAAMLFPMQGFVRFDKLFGSESNSLQIGRFEFADGSEATPKDATLAYVKRASISQRLIGGFAFTHVQRGFYGVHFQHGTPKLNWTLVGAFPTRGVFQVDGWGAMKTAFAYASVTRQVPANTTSAEWRLFGIYYDDWRDVLKTDNRPLAARQADAKPIRMGTAGAHFLHSAQTHLGTTDLTLWTAFQFGQWGALDQRAAAFVVEGGLQPPILRRVKPWVRAGYSYGSGDGDAKDGTNGTFFQLMPTPRQFALFPFYNMMNNEDVFGILIARPLKPLTLKHETHWLRLASQQDLWYLGGGAFQPWTFGFPGKPSNGGKGLANVYDINADYAFSPNVSLTAYWAYAAGHSVIASVYPANKNGSLGFLELNIKF
jgi:hypothetical protein